MSYQLKCNACNKEDWANDIIDLIKNHTDRRFVDDGGYLKCKFCGADAHIYREFTLQENRQMWKTYIRAVVQIEAEPMYFPYIFLQSCEKDSLIDGLQFSYYKDTRKEIGGKLKHGHGPGGTPSFTPKQFTEILKRIVFLGGLSKDDIIRMLDELE